MADDRIVIPVDTSLVVLAGLVGIAIGLGVALLYVWFQGPPTPPAIAAAQQAPLVVKRDEAGRIVELIPGMETVG